MAEQLKVVGGGERGGEGGGENLMEITPLGAGQEVGRSCLVLKYKGKNIMFDCGVHPAYSGLVALPYFDNVDPSEIDLLLVTHFHIDHSAALPYFLFKTNFKGRVFMTHSTKAIYRLMLADFARVGKAATEEQIFDENDLQRSMERIEVLDYHQEVEACGVRFWSYAAGHVLGAAMFMVDIAGVKFLYTGDYSREEDRHLKGAEIPSIPPDIICVESTYGVQTHLPLYEREKLYTEVIARSLQRGGRVLCPVFALGRTQELLLLLEEYWASNPELHRYPIYYASPLAKRCMSVYQTYINQMNDKIKNKVAQGNPFDFKYIQNLAGISDFDDTGPCVVFASPGMLQSGLSRQLFDRWCQNSKNALVIPGYCPEGTLAKHVLTEPKEVQLLSGQVVPLKMSVHYISFSAHADYTQTSEFLSTLNPAKIVLVHGEANEMGRMKSALQRRFENEGKSIEIFNPKNCQTVSMEFKVDKHVRAVGKLADRIEMKKGQEVSGLLVQKGFKHTLLEPEDLQTYTQLSAGTVLQKQTIPVQIPFLALKDQMASIFSKVKLEQRKGKEVICIEPGVELHSQEDSMAVLQWKSDPITDTIADSIVAVLMQLQMKPGVKKASNGVPYRVMKSLARDQGEVDTKTGEKLFNPEATLIDEVLESIFGKVEVDSSQKAWIVNVGDVRATIDMQTHRVDCKDERVESQIRVAIKRIVQALYPIDCGC
ncbi:subunit 3-I of mRNA cleavage and polyadenylation specificity factor [Chloropicon primus]|uniref:Subunit 3-I of mRNA cleavage and polyadenylation specificity factor n=1 Tax=Chloropicon primus TaxID=1764295 RepID=A0A5B8MKV2_9CHLO|nr:subunit 3-I of mRNA cleavage and polyadenylation specificity factor [Chloropicon primus]UPR00310.1 subunit 3-I of mRNA cleavage and polyadenylation specificity factor [Chloropicon primus]|eukprot:QDZ21096.1 subunit 3-I of mRNA cleavage and polyadenylation specificity factor [Chloropicon primus]